MEGQSHGLDNSTKPFSFSLLRVSAFGSDFSSINYNEYGIAYSMAVNLGQRSPEGLIPLATDLPRFQHFVTLETEICVSLASSVVVVLSTSSRRVD